MWKARHCRPWPPDRCFDMYQYVGRVILRKDSADSLSTPEAFLDLPPYCLATGIIVELGPGGLGNYRPCSADRATALGVDSFGQALLVVAVLASLAKLDGRGFLGQGAGAAHSVLGCRSHGCRLRLGATDATSFEP